MTAPGLSVCVLARDEAELLPRCLASVAWADEIVVVVDARSRDDSEKVARLYATHVERRPYEGDIEQKRATLAPSWGSVSSLMTTASARCRFTSPG